LKILLIENNKELSLLLQKYFQKHNKHVDICHDGEIGLRKSLSNQYDLLIIDTEIPPIDGLSLLRQLREIGNETPCVMITSHVDIKEEINCYKFGANFFHRKPLCFELLNIQINILLKQKLLTQKILMKDITIDLRKRLLYRKGNIVKLTKTEYELLKMLTESNGSIISRENIIANVLNYNKDIEYSSVDTMVSRIRKKLSEYGTQPVIETVTRQGYRISLDYIESSQVCKTNDKY
jgi:two-component system response regulator ArlR